jgi:ABC-type transport system involved in multi-copper enzyme maturation permease subunit
MKLRGIFRFELAYQARRGWPWLYFAVVLAVSFLMARDTALAEALYEDLRVDSPFAIAKTTVFGTLIWLLLAAPVAGEAAARDVGTRMHPLTYTTPVGRAEYLGGRFLAALALNALILLAVPLGILLGVRSPGVDAAAVGPFRPAAYVTAYAFLALPNALVATAVQFALASRSGRAMAGYLGSLLLVFMGFFVASLLLFHRGWGTLLDPIGIRFVVEDLAHRWTSIERNTRLVGLEGIVLQNRLVWLGVAAGALAVTYRSFRFAHRPARAGWRRARRHPPAGAPTPADATAAARTPIAVPEVARTFGLVIHARWTLAIAGASFRAIATSWAGLALLVGLPLLTVPVVLDQMVATGTPLVPTTARVVAELTAPLSAELSRWVIVPLLVVFFAGELVWEEREAGLGEIADTLPGSDWARLLGRLLGLALVLVAFTALQTAAGMVAQLVRGYRDLEPGLYLKILFGLQLPEYLLFAVLALVVHVLVDHKYVGHLVGIVVYAFVAVLAGMLGVEHNLLVFGGRPAWSYTPMRGFAGSVGPWLWFKAYWAAWALLLLVARGCSGYVPGARAARAAPRGARAAHATHRPGSRVWRRRCRDARWLRLPQHQRPERPSRPRPGRRAAGRVRATLPAVRAPAAAAADRGHPARRLPSAPARGGGPRHLPPGERRRAADRLGPRGHGGRRRRDRARCASTAPRRSRSTTRITAIASTPSVARSRRATRCGLDFAVRVAPRGFGNEGIDPAVAATGSYLTSTETLPQIGYQRRRELIGAADRRAHELAPRPVIASLHDAEAREPAARGGGIAFDAVIGTDDDQVAVAPGALRRTWTEGGRRYVHYATDAAIGGEWAIFSARYAVREARWRDVVIRIFHHPAHTAHLERTLRAARASLDYYGAQFGAYPYRHLTVVEHPGAPGTGMHAEASMITHGQGVPFWRPPDEPGRLDFPYAVLAHELAHQWTLPYAVVEGAPFLSEGLAWYSAMQLVRASRGEAELRRLLAFMRRPYPFPPIRRGEPLLRALDPYLAYRRGPVRMYALSEYAGADRVNGALRRLIARHDSAGVPPATTLDLYRELRAAVPRLAGAAAARPVRGEHPLAAGDGAHHRDADGRLARGA